MWILIDVMPTASSARDLKRFIARYTPDIAKLARGALARMRKRLPTAHQLVYDNYNDCGVGFSPTERASDVIFSIALYPQRALLAAKVPLSRTGKGKLIIKSISARQRPRRPAPKKSLRNARP